MTFENDQDQAAVQLQLNQGIGVDLRHLREQAQMSLEDVSAALRIQASHLAALEDGRHEDLPGAAYAIGFLRTYADYLGLNGDEAVERFKEEEAIRSKPTPLVFPAPLGETRRPGWRLALLSLVLAGAAYGAWITIEKVGGIDLERILPPPERLSDILKGNNSSKNVALKENRDVAVEAEDAKPPGQALKAPVVAAKPANAPPADKPVVAANADSATGTMKDSGPEAAVVISAKLEVAPKPAAEAQNEQRENTGNEERVAARTRLGLEIDLDSVTAPGDEKNAIVPPPPAVSSSPDAPAPRPVRKLTLVESTPVQVLPQDQADDEGPNRAGALGPATTIANVEKMAAADAASLQSPTVESAMPEADTADAADASAAALLMQQSPAVQQEEISDVAAALGIPVAEPSSAFDTPAGDSGEETTNSSPVVPPLAPQTAAVWVEPAPDMAERLISEPAADGQSVAGPLATPVMQSRPRVYGASNVDGRVVIKAHSDSWVQIQGPNRETLLTRILHAGDTYRAPSRNDLVLVTGNAGAVEIIVDGESLGLIGEFGQVRRGLSLDPEQVRIALANR